MKYFFFTRIALEGNKIHPTYATLPDDQIARYIEFWLRYSRQFYEHQDGDFDFKVGLMYSRCYAHLLSDYTFPDYVDLTMDHPAHWIRNNCVGLGPVTVTRVDADDSYSNDFMGFLGELGSMTQDALLLWKQIHQYDVASDTFYAPLTHGSPMFATIYRPNMAPFDPEDCISTDGTPLLGIVGNHGKYHLHDHVAPPTPYALMRITGWNRQNLLGLMGRQRLHPTPTSEGRSRFAGLAARNTGQDATTSAGL